MDFGTIWVTCSVFNIFVCGVVAGMMDIEHDDVGPIVFCGVVGGFLGPVATFLGISFGTGAIIRKLFLK